MINEDPIPMIDEFTYSPEQKWFVSISESHFGIHQRIINFLKELNCSSFNQDTSNEKIREIALNDIWFYRSLPEANQAIRFIINLFKSLLNKELNYQNKRRFLNTLFVFIEELFNETKYGIDINFIGNELVNFLEKSIYSDNQLRIYASSFFKKISIPFSHNTIYANRMWSLLEISLQENQKMWQDNLNYEDWCKNRDYNFYQEHSSTILKISREEKQILRETEEELFQAKNWEVLMTITDFEGFIDKLNIIKEMNKPGLEKAYFIYYLLEMPEMMGLRDSLFSELAYSFKEFPLDAFQSVDLSNFLNYSFSVFCQLKHEHMEKMIDCLLNLGKKIYQTENKKKIEIFNKHLIDFGFVYPDKIKINQDWQIEMDYNHVKMIRLWFELIKSSPKYSTELIKALIVDLKIGGVLIRDDDLFHRDISQLLGSDIKSNYFLIKQLVSLFPVFYSDIGAEGKMRELSTNIDKLSYSNDKLIHFLRKQVHTESNNTHTELAKNIFCFWYDGNTALLKKMLPDDVQNKLATHGKWFDPVHQIINQLVNKMNVGPEELLEKPMDIIKTNIEKINQYNLIDLKRVLYIIELYQLLKHKYSLGFKYIINDLKKSSFFADKQVKYLENNIHSKKHEVSIKRIYSMLIKLKKIVLGTEKIKAEESIYYKRHIASGIPSMYGKYFEKKFEAMGFILRLEKLADYLFNQYINQRDLGYMTIDGFHNAAKILKLSQEGLMIDGISNENFNSNLEMLNYSFKTTTFSMGQFVNIFYFLTLNIKEIIDSYYILPYSASLKKVIQQQIKNNEINIEENQVDHFIYKKSEEFYRDMIVSAFLIQNMDNYVSKILATLQNMIGKLRPDIISMLLNYNPKLLLSSFYQKTPKVDNQIFLGAKAYYLKKLYSYKFPIPPGFILTTEWFRDRKAIMQFPEMHQAILGMVKDKLMELEKIAKKKFGDPKNPLLLAVRSGTVIPMPGAMDSILNIGMNDEIAESMSKIPEHGWAAWDSYRRLLQNWGMAYGIERDEFDRLILEFKRIYKVEEKKQFSKEQMKSIAFSYKNLLLEHGVKLEEDPFKQLIQAIIFVFQSWYNERARIFRKKLQIAEEWGTAVIIQEMIFGNMSTESGTGVFFTKIPFEKSSEVVLYGDFSQCSQGEDVVSGLVYALPVSEFQNQKFSHLKGNSLEKQFPEIYQELDRIAKELVYQRGYEHQEIEFTFKSKDKKDLYILQTRQYSLKDKEKRPVFKDTTITENLVGKGIGIGGGAMNGLVSFSMEDLKMLSKKYHNEKKILIRPDTVPDDIEMIFECDGLLTARGGLASHAAVTAAELGKDCVVNCKQLIVYEEEKKCMINNTTFQTGDKIAIDSYLGNIYKGHHDIDLEQISYQG